MEQIDGFYAGYFTSREGVGFALFVITDGCIIGADAGGVRFDGELSPANGGFEGIVRVDAPPNGTLLNGQPSGPHGLKYEVPIRLPANPALAEFIRLETPLGPVNLKLVKLRDRNG